MIKSLRWRLVAVMMLMLSLLLALAMYLLFDTTYEGIKKDSLEALRISGMRYGLHDEHVKGPDKIDEPPKPELKDATPDQGKGPKDEIGRRDGEEPKFAIPCFVVGYDHDRVLYAEGTRYYDLEDTDYLESIFQAAREHGGENGILREQKLRFLKLGDVCGEAYAFTDVTAEGASLVRLMNQYFLIGLLVMAGFFLICMLVTHWAVRPVDQVMKQQRLFIADASHELKTPLTVILTNAELLHSEDYSVQEKKTFSDSILTMAQQMRGLVEELLDLARMDSGIGNLQMQTVELSQLVENAVLPFEPVYFESGRMITSHIESGIRVWGCPHALQKVVEILLDNGWKYSEPDSTVTIKLVKVCSKHCQITVESRGDTMTKQECRDIFKRFYRRDPSRSGNHSYGLGLSIAKTVIRQHKGRIYAKSKDGVNTFYIDLITK